MIWLDGLFVLFLIVLDLYLFGVIGGPVEDIDLTLGLEDDDDELFG